MKAVLKILAQGILLSTVYMIACVILLPEPHSKVLAFIGTLFIALTYLDKTKEVH